MIMSKDEPLRGGFYDHATGEMIIRELTPEEIASLVTADDVISNEE